MPYDALVYITGWTWMYECTRCGFRTEPLLHRRAELVMRIHRHRHTMNLIHGHWQPNPYR